MTTADLPPAYGGPQPTQPGPDPFQRNTGVEFDTPQQLPPQPPPQAAPQQQAGPPVFGRRTETSKRVQFTLAVYQGETEQQHLLTARADVDTASVFGFGRGNQTLGVQIETIRKLLMRTLVDDDGISVHAPAEEVVILRPGQPDEEIVPAADLTNEIRSIAQAADILWRTPEVTETSDGTTTVTVPEKLHDSVTDAHDHMREHGSSLRRFAAIMDDDRLWIEQTALEQILDYLMTQAAEGRPTQRSSASSRSRRRTGR